MDNNSRFSYYGFWSGFYRDYPNMTPFRAILESLFKHTNKNIDIHSVFPDRKIPIKSDTTTLAVHYSGEPFHDPPDNFDLNLVMEADNQETKTVWCPLFSLGSYENKYWPLYWTPRHPPIAKSRFCAFIVTNEKAALRNRFFHKLSQYKRVDSCGWAMNNCGFRAPYEGYHNFLQQFKFMICFENTSKSHYITEKLYNAYLGGTIPIYWGCPNAQKWFNPKSFLYLDENASDEAMDELIAKIIELDNDDVKYAAMHKELLLPNGQIPREMSLEAMQEKITNTLK